MKRLVMDKEKAGWMVLLLIVVVLIGLYTFVFTDVKVLDYEAELDSIEGLNNNGFQASNISEDYNVLLIVLDTTRPDHLGAYGYPKNTSPNIDSLADEGVLFKNAFTTIPYTPSAHISMMTSTYPFVFQPRIPGAAPTGNVLIGDEYITLAEILRYNNYKTAGFVSVGLMSNHSGLNQGFDKYEVAEGVWTANKTVPKAVEWLDENYQSNFFMWVHLYDPHDPYSPPNNFSELHHDYEVPYDKVGVSGVSSIKQVLADYDGDISYSDQQIGLLLERLKELGVENNTLVVFTSDHGEQFGEHLPPYYRGMSAPLLYQHARALYEDEVHIPLIIKMPRKIEENITIEGLVENIDITPTILELLNISVPSQFQGRSMTEAIAGKENITRKYVFSHLYPIISPYYKSMVRTEDYKLIYDHYNQESQLFNLSNDEYEMVNLYDNETEIVSEMEDEMIDLIQEYTVITDLHVPDIRSESVEKLKALGYLV